MFVVEGWLPTAERRTFIRKGSNAYRLGLCDLFLTHARLLWNQATKKHDCKLGCVRRGLGTPPGDCATDPVVSRTPSGACSGGRRFGQERFLLATRRKDRQVNERGIFPPS